MTINKSPANEAHKPEATTSARFKDAARWKSVLLDVFVWFMFGGLLTSMLTEFAPGYPIVVGTPSVQTGVYWLNRRATTYVAGDFVTFPFNPEQTWLRERYVTEKLVHTKMVVGVPGDVVFSDSALNLKVCRRQYTTGLLRWCREIGKPQLRDSRGREMHPWLTAGNSYTLRAGEFWVSGLHPKSLDSRYHGPVAASLIRGTATLLFAYGPAPEMEIPLDKQKFIEEPP